MKLGVALESCSSSPGKLFARPRDWEKMGNDATGYGPFCLVLEEGEIFKWVAWSTYDDRFTQGGLLRLGREYFEKEWEVVSKNDLMIQALENLNSIEQKQFEKEWEFTAMARARYLRGVSLCISMSYCWLFLA
jgi:hypothetical protein